MSRRKEPTFWSYTTRVYDLTFGQVRISRIGTGGGTVEGVPGLLTIKDLGQYITDLKFVLENEASDG